MLLLRCLLDHRKRSHSDEVETVVHSDSDFATVAYLRVKKASLQPKTFEALDVTVPPVLEKPFSVVRYVVENHTPPLHDTTFNAPEPLRTLPCPRAASRKIGRWVAVTNVERHLGEQVRDISIEDEVRECFETLQGTHSLGMLLWFTFSSQFLPTARLAKYSLTLANCANINIFLSSMDLFAQVNAVYATYFGTSPPARACVAVDLPAHIHVRLDCIAYAERTPSERQALHVQGLSYWAPANIGPYSQAIVVSLRCS